MSGTVSSKIVEWLIERSKKTPYFHLENYMERYWLIPYGWWVFAARIHHILASDSDRAFHDHPWPYITIILKGGYWEIRPCYNTSGIYTGESRHWYGPGSVIKRPAKSYHRLVLPEGQTAWTLFITGPYQQGWGFLKDPIIKIPYREYLNIKD